MLEDEEAIDRLEHDLRRLKIDFERFFSGGLKTPPEQLRQSVSTQINSMRSRHIRTFALRFRLHNLEARFHIFSVLFSRRLQELEAGTGRRARPEVRKVDPHDGIVFDDKPDPEAVAVLYRELCRARKSRSRDCTSMGCVPSVWYASTNNRAPAPWAMSTRASRSCLKPV